MAITLPQAPNEVEIDLKTFRFHIFGFPKIGKTTLASFWPKPLFIQSERGTKGMPVYSVDVDSWADILEVERQLLEEQAAGKARFETIVFDTIDRAYYFATLKVAADNGVAHVSALDYGAGWDEANKMLYNLLERLYKYFGVVLISHARRLDVLRGHVKATVIVPDLSDSPRRVVTRWVDGAIYLGMEEVAVESEVAGQEPVVETRRVAVCHQTPYIEAGGRTVFRFMPPAVDLGNTPAEGFQNFYKAFTEAGEKLLEEFGAMRKLAADTVKARQGKKERV
jgi:hypothetical protein